MSKVYDVDDNMGFNIFTSVLTYLSGNSSIVSILALYWNSCLSESRYSKSYNHFCRGAASDCRSLQIDTKMDVGSVGCLLITNQLIVPGAVDVIQGGIFVVRCCKNIKSR